MRWTLIVILMLFPMTAMAGLPKKLAGIKLGTKLKTVLKLAKKKKWGQPNIKKSRCKTELKFFRKESTVTALFYKDRAMYVFHSWEYDKGPVIGKTRAAMIHYLKRARRKYGKRVKLKTRKVGEMLTVTAVWIRWGRDFELSLTYDANPDNPSVKLNHFELTSRRHYKRHKRCTAKPANRAPLP